MSRDFRQFQAGTEASRRRIARWRGSFRARTCIWSPARSTMKASSSPSYRWRIRWYGKSPWFCGNGAAFGRGCTWWVYFVPRELRVLSSPAPFYLRKYLYLCALRLKGIFFPLLKIAINAEKIAMLPFLISFVHSLLFIKSFSPSFPRFICISWNW